MFDQRLVGGYFQLVSELSSGGFGQTFLAADLRGSDGARYVVKQLKPQSDAPEVLDLAKRLFEQEVKTLYRLGEHPQIPSIITHFEEAGEFYFVQEYIEGNTFAEEVRQGTIYSQRQTLEIVRDLLSVLAFVHRHDVIHRDIKPSNLICRKSDGKIVLIDFGAVKQFRNNNAGHPHQMTTGTVAIGSEGYMPMEQIAGHPKFSSDVYAVGMFAVQLLTQTHPTQLRQSQRTGEWIWQDKVSVNVQFAEFLNRMIRFDFRQRFADAVEALNYLSRMNLIVEQPENAVWNQPEAFGNRHENGVTQATFFTPVSSQPEFYEANQPAKQFSVNYQPNAVEPVFAPPPILYQSPPLQMPVVQNLKPLVAPQSNLSQNTQPLTRAAVPYKLGSSERVEMGESITVGSSAFDGFGESRYLKGFLYLVLIIFTSGTLIHTFIGMIETRQREAKYGQPQSSPQSPPSLTKTQPVESPRAKENSEMKSFVMAKEAKARTSEEWFAVAADWKKAEEFYSKLETLATTEQEKESARKDREYCASKKETAFKNSERINKKTRR